MRDKQWNQPPQGIVYGSNLTSNGSFRDFWCIHKLALYWHWIVIGVPMDSQNFLSCSASADFTWDFPCTLLSFARNSRKFILIWRNTSQVARDFSKISSSLLPVKIRFSTYKFSPISRASFWSLTSCFRWYRIVVANKNGDTFNPKVTLVKRYVTILSFSGGRAVSLIQKHLVTSLSRSCSRTCRNAFSTSDITTWDFIRNLNNIPYSSGSMRGPWCNASFSEGEPLRWVEASKTTLISCLLLCALQVDGVSNEPE